MSQSASQKDVTKGLKEVSQSEVVKDSQRSVNMNVSTNNVFKDRNVNDLLTAQTSKEREKKNAW